MIRPVLTGTSAVALKVTGPPSYRSLTSSSEAEMLTVPVQPESFTSSLRYSSACRPMAEAFTRMGRSLETTVTSRPSNAKFWATARIRESLSPERKPWGRTSVEMWFSSTRRLPPSEPSGTGRFSEPCSTRSSSSRRRALRA